MSVGTDSQYCGASRQTHQLRGRRQCPCGKRHRLRPAAVEAASCPREGLGQWPPGQDLFPLQITHQEKWRLALDMLGTLVG